jgi:hypothetical protein
MILVSCKEQGRLAFDRYCPRDFNLAFDFDLQRSVREIHIYLVRDVDHRHWWNRIRGTPPLRWIRTPAVQTQ